MPARAGGPRRAGVRGTAGRDMVRTLLVILAVVVLMFFLVPRPGR